MSATHAHPNYVKIWFWLVILLIISTVGPMFEIPIVTLITAFGIAVVKAFMVAANFMHLNSEKKMILWILILTIILLIPLLFIPVMWDINNMGNN